MLSFLDLVVYLLSVCIVQNSFKTLEDQGYVLSREFREALILLVPLILSRPS
jgi:hypothetical protein